jgi:hypothetical protein
VYNISLSGTPAKKHRLEINLLRRFKMDYTVDIRGMTTQQLEELRQQIIDDFSHETNGDRRDALARFYYTVCNCLPHTFVLWSLFEVENHEEEIPDHVLEDDPLLEWVPYPQPEGEK